MKGKERMLWVFITGCLAGTLYFFHLSPFKDTADNLTTDSIHYPLLDIANSYLQEYYISPEKLDRKQLLYGAAEGLYKATGDEYTAIFPPHVFKEFTADISGKIAGIGVYLQKQEQDIFILSLVPKSPAIEAGLKIGDKLININEIPISNFSIEEISSRIQGEENSWVTLDIFRPSTQQYKNIKVLRSVISLPSVFSQIIKETIHYIKITDFSDNTADEVKKVLKLHSQAQALILDLRNNPGGQIDSSNTIAGFLLPEKTPIVSIKSPHPEENLTYYTKPKSLLVNLKRPIVVLINEQSASAAEILAAALKDNNRAILVGKKTYGKGSIQSIFSAEYDHETFGIKITTAHYLTPSGKDINHIGIQPNISVDLPTITPLEQTKLDSILENRLLEKNLGNHLEYPLTLERFAKIQTDLLENNLTIPANLLRRIIQEQKNIVQGQLYTVEWNFDSQLAKAIETVQKNLKG